MGKMVPMIEKSFRVSVELERRMERFAAETGRSVSEAYRFCADQGERLHRVAKALAKVRGTMAEEQPSDEEIKNAQIVVGKLFYREDAPPIGG